MTFQVRTLDGAANDRLKTIVFFLMAASIAGPVCTPASADDELPPTVSAALQRAQIPESAVGLFVQRVGAGERPPASGASNAAAPTPRNVPSLLSLRSERAMNPASTMKLVTTYAALELLGPAFTWKTTLASNGAINAGQTPCPHCGAKLEWKN